MLSFSHQENMLYETFLSISIGKNVYDFDRKRFTANLFGEQCFIVKNHYHKIMLKALPGDLSIDYVQHLQCQIKISRKLTMKRITVSGEVYRWYEGRNEGKVRDCESL